MARTLLVGVAAWTCPGAAGFGSAVGFGGTGAALTGAAATLVAAFAGFLATTGGGTGFLAMAPLRVASGLAALGATFGGLLAPCALALATLADGRAAALRSGDLDFFVTALAAVFLRVILLVPLATSDCIPNFLTPLQLGITIPPTGGSRRAPHGVDRAPGCRALAQRPSRALIVWFGRVESAGAPPRAHIQSEAVRVGISASPAKRCTDFVHATTICTDYNTNFTHFEAAACCFAVAASRLRPCRLEHNRNTPPQALRQPAPRA